MEKTLEYYLRLPYTRELIPEPEGGWFIRIKELPGCMSQGDTADDAIAMIEDAMKGWIEAELHKGSAIPEPRPDEEFSGKFVVRVAKSLHRKISEISTVEGVSLNQWIGTTLAEAVGETRVTLANKIESSVEVSSGLFRAMESNIELAKNHWTKALNSAKLESDQKALETWVSTGGGPDL